MPITTFTGTADFVAGKIPAGAKVIAITVSGTKMDVFTAFVELPPQAVEEEEEEEEEQVDENPSAGGKSKRTRRRRRRHA